MSADLSRSPKSSNAPPRRSFVRGGLQQRRPIAFLGLIFLLFHLIFGFAAPVAAQEAAATTPPAKVQQLIELLDDPEVRQWLSAKQATPPPAAATQSSGVASQWVAQIRRHLGGMREAAPRLVPEWMAARERITADMHQGTMPILRGLGFVLLVGYGAEFLLRYLLRRSAHRSAGQFSFSAQRPDACGNGIMSFDAES
jgi:small conductance mechanosensitive channel